jgi:hypothetical protein
MLYNVNDCEFRLGSNQGSTPWVCAGFVLILLPLIRFISLKVLTHVEGDANMNNKKMIFSALLETIWTVSASVTAGALAQAPT